MDSYKILNLPAPTTNTEPLRKGDIVSDATGATVQYVDDSIEESMQSKDFISIKTLQQAIEDTSAREGDYIRISDRGGALFQYITGSLSANGYNIISHSSISDLYLNLSSDFLKPTSWGALGNGVNDDTGPLRAMLNHGSGVELDSKTYLVSLPTSEDAGNDRVFNFNSTTASYFVGKGRESVIKLDSQNSIDADFDIIGLDLRDPIGGVFTIGNFTVDGDRDNASQNQSNTLYRFQTGSIVTASYYEVNLLPLWGFDSTGGGCYMGCDLVNFSLMTFDNIGEHGAAIRNTSGDGRLIQVYGKGVVADNCDGLAFDYSGGSQVNGGPCRSHIGFVRGKGNAFGSKVAGNHFGVLDFLSLEDTNLDNQSLDSAFYANEDFESFSIGTYECKNSYTGALSHVDSGTMTVGKLVSIGNNSSSNPNGDIVQSNENSSLTIHEYHAEGHEDSTRAINILDGKSTKINISSLSGFDSTSNYPIRVQTNGHAEISGLISQDNDSGVWLSQLNTMTDGQINLFNTSFAGNKAGNGVLLSGGGDVFMSDVNVNGFQGVKVSDSGQIGQYSNTKGFKASANTSSLESISSRVNTQDKYEGKVHFNSTTNKPVYATGSDNSSVWVDSIGTIVHTPA